MIWLLLACNKGEEVAPVDDSDELVVRESSPFIETGLHSGESGETGDTGLPDTSLAVYPSEAVLGVGGQIGLRVVASDTTGAHWDAAEVELVADETVLTVLDGLVTALAPGEGVVTVLAEGLETSATFTVRDTHELVVHLVSAETGAPLTDGRVQVSGNKQVADETGTVVVGVADGSPLVLTAYDASEEIIPAVVFDVSVRELTLALRHESAEAPPTAILLGELDFASAVPSDWDELIIAMSGPSVQGHPLFFDGDALIGDDRTVDFFGADVGLPGNVSVEEVDTSWTSVAEDGVVGAWSFAVPVKIADASSGIATVTEAIKLLADRTEDIRWSWVPGLVADSATPLEQDLAPDQPLVSSYGVLLPSEMPEAFYGTEDVLLLALEEVDEGYALVGVGAGQGNQTVSRASLEGYGGSLLAYAEVGGVGIGGARLLQLLPEEEVVEPRPWLEPPAITSWEGGTRTVEFSTDPGHHLVRVYVLGFSGGHRDLYMAGGAIGGTIPEEGPAMSVGRTIWRLTAVETAEGNFHSALVTGGLDPTSLHNGAVSTGLLEEYKTGG
ncbi:MAG TPA: hypothetical protein QGF58_21055 [Myxococcota bacterium]|nr:hypothetical protein [Myxococcota bacterium]